LSDAVPTADLNVISKKMKDILLIVLLLSFINLFGQERYTNINGQKYRIKDLGKGDITVILESGMSDSLEVWDSIPDSISEFTRVFLYDRADIGKSDTSLVERTIPNMVNELKSILQQENIKPPYILVGHSLGGLITRYFSSEYSDEAKGLLLLDPSPEAFWDEMSKRQLKKYIKGGNEWYETKFPPRYRKEWYQFLPNLEYMKNLHIPGDLPIILVSASAWNWYKYQSKMLVGFENTKHIELEGQHHIYKDHPDLIVEYIRELLYR
jgi:pimeloyl-ACP methyl ester carboxylesterase